MTSSSSTSPSESAERPAPRRRRALLMPLLVLAVFVGIEAALRLAHFGVPAVITPWRYAPSEVVAMGLTQQPAEAQVKRQLKPQMHSLLKGEQFTTNSAGFRDREFSRERPANVVRIAVLGTSIEMGSGVADDEIYSRRLQQKLDAVEPGRYEVLNFAISGSSFREIVATYNRLVAQFEPDAVMLPLQARVPRGPGRKAKKPRTEASSQQPPYARRVLDRLFAYKAIRKLAHDWTSSWLATNWATRSAAKARRPSARRTLAPFFNARAQEGVPVFLIAYPTLANPWGKRLDARVAEAQRWIGEFEHVHLIDTRAQLRETITSTDYAFYGDMHPNARIHEALAAAIFAQWATISSTLAESQRVADLGS